MTPDERKAEIERLERVRQMSEQMGTGFKGRIEAIDRRLAELRDG